jgi:transposase-like protein
MIDFPLTDLLDDAECLAWLEHHLHPQGFVCPHCGSSARRLFRRQHIPAYRCRDCDGYYTVVTGTVFEKTRQRPATLVLILRGVAKGESTARLSRELNLDRKRLGAIRQQLQNNLYETLPTDVLAGKEFEADELYQNTGGKKVRRILMRPTYRDGARTNGAGVAPTRTTAHQSSAWSAA